MITSWILAWSEMLPTASELSINTLSHNSFPLLYHDFLSVCRDSLLRINCPRRDLAWCHVKRGLFVDRVAMQVMMFIQDESGSSRVQPQRCGVCQGES